MVKECGKWAGRKRANRKMIQSILGKLIYISACVEQGRKFVSRILDTLRAMGDKNWTWISHEFRKDIESFQRYGAVLNGITFLRWRGPRSGSNVTPRRRVWEVIQASPTRHQVDSGHYNDRQFCIIICTGNRKNERLCSGELLARALVGGC